MSTASATIRRINCLYSFGHGSLQVFENVLVQKPLNCACIVAGNKGVLQSLTCPQSSTCNLSVAPAMSIHFVLQKGVRWLRAYGSRCMWLQQIQEKELEGFVHGARLELIAQFCLEAFGYESMLSLFRKRELR